MFQNKQSLYFATLNQEIVVLRYNQYFMFNLPFINHPKKMLQLKQTKSTCETPRSLLVKSNSSINFVGELPRSTCEGAAPAAVFQPK